MNLQIGKDILFIHDRQILNCPSCGGTSEIKNEVIRCPKCNEKHVIVRTLKDKLHELKALKGLKTNEELADFLGVHLSTLRNWLSGRFNPNEEQGIKLQSIFELEGV